MIATKNLHRRIEGAVILNNITAQVHAGDVIALLGKNGAGKTTLLETLLGFSFPTQGDAEILGVKATDMLDSTKQRIGFVPQQSELLLGLTGKEHIELFKAYRPRWNPSLVDKLIIDWAIPMDIALGKMSVGQQQKLSILLAIAHEPELLVLDEPVASLDPVARRQFLQQLIEISADANRAIVFSSHIVSDMERIANKVWMLQAGELTYQGELDELKESIVRITILARQPLPSDLNFSHNIKQRVHGNQAVITLRNWMPSMQQEIEQALNATVQVEYLSLEDIFLELNS